MLQVVEAAAPEPRDSFTQRVTDWVFGYDYFISYSHRDGKNYPRLLKERLERAGFRVFLDQTDYAPGTNLSRETRRQVLKSKVIVVVGREGALASTWVKREVDIALAHSRDPVIIDINGAMAKAQPGAGIVDTVRKEHWLRLLETVEQVPNEAGVLVDDGNPTDKAVGELIRSFGHTRQQRIRYRMLAGVAGILGLAAVVASQQAVVARRAEHRADNERINAEVTNQRLIARKADQLADAGDGTAATQLALESAIALRDRRSRPAAADALADAHRSLHAAHYARRELAVLKGEKSVGTAIAFSPDGSKLAVGKRGGAVEIYDRDGTPLVQLKHTATIASVTFSPDSSRLLTASLDATAQQWNATTGERIGPAMRHEGGIHRAGYDRNGTRIVTAGADKRAAIWDAGDGRPLHALADHGGPVRDARFSPDGQRIATACDDGKVRLWQTSDGNLELTLEGADGHVDVVRTVSFSGDGRQLVSAGVDKWAVVWNLEAGTSRRLAGHDDTLFGAAFDPSSRRVLTFSEDFTARVWSSETGQQLLRLQHDAWVQSGEFSPDGTEVLTASKENAVRLWDLATGELKTVLTGHDTSEKIATLATFDPKTELVATTSWDGTSRLWTAAAGVEIKVLKTGQNQVLAAAFNRDGTMVATGTPGGLNTGYLSIWNAMTGARIHGPLTTPGRNWRLAFHPHRDTVAAVAGRNADTGASSVILLDVPSKRVATLVHAPRVASNEALRSVHYSADGTKLLSAGQDGKARIWNTTTFEQIGPALDHGAGIHVAAFDATANRVVTGGLTG